MTTRLLLLTIRLLLLRKRYAILISPYVSTMTNHDKVKKKFYEDLQAAIATVPKADKLVILGDFNAGICTDYTSWVRVFGKNEVGKCNSNSSMLLESCTAHELLITNTVFRLPKRNKTTWMHSRSKHWHLLDSSGKKTRMTSEPQKPCVKRSIGQSISCCSQS